MQAWVIIISIICFGACLWNSYFRLWYIDHTNPTFVHQCNWPNIRNVKNSVVIQTILISKWLNDGGVTHQIIAKMGMKIVYASKKYLTTVFKFISLSVNYGFATSSCSNRKVSLKLRKECKIVTSKVRKPMKRTNGTIRIHCKNACKLYMVVYWNSSLSMTRPCSKM